MISEFPISVTPILEWGYCDIRKSPISGTVISGKTPISELARIQMTPSDVLQWEEIRAEGRLTTVDDWM